MKLMRKIPGGTMLVPMFISALINTIYPSLFHIGGVTEAFIAGRALNFVLGAAIFISGCILKLSTIKHVLKRYLGLFAFRTALCAAFSVLFYKLFGLEGVLGISLIAFIASTTSMNPSIFLAVMEDFGDEVDTSAFGLISLLATPVIPLLIFSLTQPTKIDILPIVSIVVPLILGVIVGNLDPDLGSFMASGMPFTIFMLGWCVGARIDLLEAFRAGFAGIVMVVLYYVLTVLPVLLFEKKIQKRSGLSTFGISTMAGLSASVPLTIAETNPEIAKFAPRAAAIVTMGVVVTSIVSPYFAKKAATKAKN